MTDTEHDDDRGLEVIKVAPTVFLSYRRADTRDVAENFSERLRKDLGSTNVFRDEEDLIGGQIWPDVLADTIAGSDVVLFLIGEQWTGERPDGSRRIDEPSDAVRSEVRHALHHPVGRVPILVDITEPPTLPPSDVEPLFEGRNWLPATRVNLGRRASADYQGVLVSVWEAFRARVVRAVLIVGSTHAGAHVDELVHQLRAGGAIDARKLSRFASGAIIASARKARRGHRRWPQVIVVVESGDEHDEATVGLITALYRHPAITSVALVAAGAATGVAGTLTVLASSATGSGTTVTTHTTPELIASLPNAGSGISGAVSTSWANAATGTKIAVTVGAIAAAAAAGVGLRTETDDGDGQSIVFADSTIVSVSNNPAVEEDPRLFPLGRPNDAVVKLGPPERTAVGDRDGVDYVSRQVSVQLGELDQPVNLGSAILPTSLPEQPDEASDGQDTLTVELIDETLDLAIVDMPAADFCYNTDRPSELLAGWRFIGGRTTVTVVFYVVTGAGDVTGTQIAVYIDGPAKREPLPETPRDYQFGPCCLENGHEGDGGTAVLFSARP